MSARLLVGPHTTARASAQPISEPLTDPDAIARAVRFVLGRPQLFLDSSSAFDQLPKVLAAVRRRRSRTDLGVLRD